MRSFNDPMTIFTVVSAGLSFIGGIAQGQQEEAAAKADASFLRAQASQEERARQRDQRDLEKEARRSTARTLAVLASEGGGFGGTGQALLESQAGEFGVQKRRINADSAVRQESLRVRARNTEVLGEAARDAAIFGGAARAAQTAAPLLRRRPNTRGEEE